MISWKSRAKAILALSFVEVEYKSLSRLTTGIVWLSRLLDELTISSITPIFVKCDSQLAIYIVRNPVFHERMERTEMDYYFVREKLLWKG